MASSEDRAHIERLLRKHKRRLRILEEKAADLGSAVDPAILIDIEDIQATMAQLSMALVPAPAKEVKEAVSKAYDNWTDLLIAQLGKFHTRQTEFEITIEAIKQQNYEATLSRLGMIEDIRELKEGRLMDNRERRRNQWLFRAIWIGIAVVIVLVALFGRVYL